MATCPHGIDAGSCMICRTLGMSTTTAAVPAPEATKGGSIRAGKAEVLGPGRRKSSRIGGLGLIGWLVVIVAVALLGWWILGLIWAVLRLVELVAVGLLCGFIGYKIGVVSGRHQARG